MMMRELGIVFGFFDFLVNNKNEYIFLEVNQMGQFLFIERRADAYRKNTLSMMYRKRAPMMRNA